MIRPLTEDLTVALPGPVFTGPKVGAIAGSGSLGITSLVIGILMFLHIIQPIPTAMYALVGSGTGILLVDVIVLVALSIQYYKLGQTPPSDPTPEHIETVLTPPPSDLITAPPLTQGADKFYKYNYSDIPLLRCQDGLAYTFSLLDPREICKIATTCRAFSVCASRVHLANASEVKERIRSYTHLAQQFDSQILQLTHGRHSLIGNHVDQNLISPFYQHQRFTFPLDQWSVCVDNSQSPNVSCNSMILLNRCRFDLIEALAEFNIEAGFFKSEGGSHSVPDGVVTPLDKRLIAEIILQERSREAEEILEAAKSTLKGVCFILWSPTESCPKGVNSQRPGPGYIGLEIVNRESSQSWRNNYERGRKSFYYYPIEPLIGLREGDRISMPSAALFNKQEERVPAQFLLPGERLPTPGRPCPGLISFIPGLFSEKRFSFSKDGVAEEEIILRCQGRLEISRIHFETVHGTDFEDIIIYSMIGNALAVHWVNGDISLNKQALCRAQSAYGVDRMRAAFALYLKNNYGKPNHYRHSFLEGEWREFLYQFLFKLATYSDPPLTGWENSIVTECHS